MVMKIEQAIMHAIDGNAVLFLGSGFSADAISLSGEKFPTSKILAKQLSNLCSFEDEIDDLMIASNAYIKKYGEVSLINLLEQKFTVRDTASKHDKLPEIPWKSIFTTNYDDIVEVVFRKKNIRIKPLTIDMDSHEYTSKKNTCIHINGYIGTLTSSSLKSSFKLTNYSYLTEEFSKSNWSFIFRKEVEEAKTVIFIGYSMYDIDIARILFADKALKEKTIFIEREGLNQESYQFSTQNELGTIYPIGLNSFWDKFDKINFNYEKKDDKDILFSLTKYEPKLLETPSTDNDYWALILKGDYDVNLVYSSILSKSSYYTNRKESIEISELILANKRAIFVLGDLGNGKTMVMLGAATNLLRHGYEVYFLNDSNEFHFDDISIICKKDKPIVIFIENYIRHLDALKILLLRAQSNIKIICSARSVIHEVNTYRLDEIFHDSEYYEIYVDKLKNEEIEIISDTLTSYKVWGKHDSWSKERKIKHIKNECKQEFSSLLIDIASSPDIQERYSSIFSVFKDKSEVGNIFLTAATLSMLGYEPSSSTISELTNSRFVYTNEFKSNAAVLQMASLGGGAVVPRSSVIAKYSMTHFSDATAVVDNLVKITVRAHELGQSNNLFGRHYFNIYRDLVTFSVLKPMIPLTKNRESLIRFYEAMKELNAAKTHPHFWLQYAIARLSMETIEDAQKAKHYLDAAYAHANRRENYHTKHLDNVLARYHLFMASRSMDRLNVMENIIEARKLLIKEVSVEKTEAPYKVAKLFSAVYLEKKSILLETDINFIKDFMRNIISNSNLLPDIIRGKQSVNECVRQLEESLAN